MRSASCLRFGAVVAAALLSTSLMAAEFDIGATTKLEHCPAGTCLRIAGRRADPSAPVLIAGHAVAVEGANHWRVALPLATIKEWTAPFARSITVHVAGAEAAEMKARLPTGLLGHDIDLAYLDVRAPH